MLKIALGLLLRDLGLAHHRVLDQRRHRVHLFLNTLGNGVVHAYNAHLPVDIRGIGRALGPHERQNGALVALSGEHSKERIVLNVAVLINIGVHVIHHAVDLIVEQRVGRKCCRLDLPVGQ